MLDLKKRKKGSGNRRCRLHRRCYRFGSSAPWCLFCLDSPLFSLPLFVLIFFLYTTSVENYDIEELSYMLEKYFIQN